MSYIANILDISTKPRPLRSLPSMPSSKPNVMFLAPLLLRLAHLAMLFILQMTYTPGSACHLKNIQHSHTIYCQKNIPCALTDTLVNLGSPEEHYRGFPAIFVHFLPIFAYSEGNIPSESAGVRLFNQERLFSTKLYLPMTQWSTNSVLLRWSNKGELIMMFTAYQKEKPPGRSNSNSRGTLQGYFNNQWWQNHALTYI